MRHSNAETTNTPEHLSSTTYSNDAMDTTLENVMDTTLETPEEDQDDIDLLDADEPRIFTPPPRIAARFYKPTNTQRRKTSAASSRRNSISSAHSHQSSLAACRHGSAQSSIVAQHLRRASILETRKARLADRAAHAEKVRLRAALAKAAPRNTKDSEERALAAHQAREKNLAEIVASCAEEVKRAKGIAEAMKERREAENKRLRREMEERAAEAERRREEILNRGNAKRGRSASAPRKSTSPSVEVVKETMSKDTAAVKIQQKWRAHQRWKILKDFADLGLTIDGVVSKSFDTATELLAQELIVIGTAKVLRICGLEEGEVNSVDEMKLVRQFLGAYVILGHPTQVLSGNGTRVKQEQVGVARGSSFMRRDDLANPQLQDLVAKARDLLISFENVLSCLTANNNYIPSPAKSASLLESYETFHRTFLAWKVRDSSAMVQMMVAQFVELEKIWITVKDSTEEAVVGPYRDGIRHNQTLLVARIKRLAGAEEGIRLLRQAHREAVREAAKKSTGDIKPRTAEASSSTSKGPDKTAPISIQTSTPPPSPRPKNSRRSTPALFNSASPLPDNRIVLHEVAINRDYRISEKLLRSTRGSSMDSLWVTMKADIAANNGDRWVLPLTEMFRAQLQSLVPSPPPADSIYHVIGEQLDSERLGREVERGSFSYEQFFSFMTTIIPRLCAPVRDAEFKALLENLSRSNDFVDRIKGLTDFIDLMHMDYGNYHLSIHIPQLLKEAPGYEQRHFAADLESGIHGLDLAKKGWAAARTKVHDEVAKRDPENINLPRSRSTPDKIYIRMITDLFTDIPPLIPIQIPETLCLDTDRVHRIRLEILHIITAGAILLQSKNVLKRDVRSQWKIESTRILSVLKDSTSVDQSVQGITAALESSHSMPMATKTLIRQFVQRIVEQCFNVSRAASTILTEPVMRLLLNRLKGHVFSRLSATTATEKVRTTSGASEVLATAGLPEFVGSVGKMVEEIGRCVAVDKAAHGIWYEMVSKEVDAESAEVADAATI